MSNRKLYSLFALLLIVLSAVIGIIVVPTPQVRYPLFPLEQEIELSPNKPLVIIFDRPISHELIPSISPSLPGTWKFQTGRYGLLVSDRLVFTPSPEVELENEYVISLDRVLPVTWLSLKQAQQYLFVVKVASSPTKSISHLNILDNIDIMSEVTPTPEVMVDQLENGYQLNVPLIKQHYKFTCYSAASLMVLGYRNINSITELSFLDEIGYDQTPRSYVPNNTWGDPAKGIVGTYDGSNDGGYGVHWMPVAKALAKYRPVEVKENWNLDELLKTVEDGNPVMVWWVNGVWPAKELRWQSESGNTVRGVNGMHVEVVTGWVGSRKMPEYILTNDPWRGYRRYTPKAFEALWRWFNNSAIVVY